MLNDSCNSLVKYGCLIELRSRVLNTLKRLCISCANSVEECFGAISLVCGRFQEWEGKEINCYCSPQVSYLCKRKLGGGGGSEAVVSSVWSCSFALSQPPLIAIFFYTYKPFSVVAVKVKKIAKVLRLLTSDQ